MSGAGSGSLLVVTVEMVDKLKRALSQFVQDYKSAGSSNWTLTGRSWFTKAGWDLRGHHAPQNAAFQELLINVQAQLAAAKNNDPATQWEILTEAVASIATIHKEVTGAGTDSGTTFWSAYLALKNALATIENDGFVLLNTVAVPPRLLALEDAPRRLTLEDAPRRLALEDAPRLLALEDAPPRAQRPSAPFGPSVFLPDFAFSVLVAQFMKIYQGLLTGGPERPLAQPNLIPNFPAGLSFSVAPVPQGLSSYFSPVLPYSSAAQPAPSSPLLLPNISEDPGYDPGSDSDSDDSIPDLVPAGPAVSPAFSAPSSAPSSPCPPAMPVAQAMKTSEALKPRAPRATLQTATVMLLAAEKALADKAAKKVAASGKTAMSKAEKKEQDEYVAAKKPKAVATLVISGMRPPKAVLIAEAQLRAEFQTELAAQRLLMAPR